MTQQRGFAVMTDGCRIAWQLEGPENAPFLVLSNSLGTAMSMWDAQVPAFSSQFRVLRYDTRGHGASDAPSGDYGLDRLGRDVLELLDSHGIEKAHFCGLSLGGMTAQWLGVFAPDRIHSLVIANSSAFMGPPESWQKRMEQVRLNGMGAIVDAVLDRWFTPEFAAPLFVSYLACKSQFLATDPGGYAGCCAAIRDMDLRPIVHLIKTPTLIIGGLVDLATPIENSQFLHDRIENGGFVTINARHLSNVEQPEQFTEAVLNFLLD